MQFLKRLFGFAETDLTRILASFRSTLAQLDAHVTYHLDAAQKQGGVAHDALLAQSHHEVQAETAQQVFRNISRLIGAS